MATNLQTPITPPPNLKTPTTPSSPNQPTEDDDVPSTTTTIIDPLTTHTHTIIFLHGREDFGSYLSHDLFLSKSSSSPTPESLREIFPTIKWIFPTAKLRYSAQMDFQFSNSSFAEALKGEEIISQWFDVWDIKEPEERRELVIPGLRESVVQIVEILKEESEIVSMEKILLGGISQGCATAIYALLASGLNVGGFVGVSSWLPLRGIVETILRDVMDGKDGISREIRKMLGIFGEESFSEGSTLTSKEQATETGEADMEDLLSTLNTLSLRPQPRVKTPVFLSHSKDDETVPFTHGEELKQSMQNMGFSVTWKEYEDGGHWIHDKHGVDGIVTFLRGVWGI